MTYTYDDEVGWMGPDCPHCGSTSYDSINEDWRRCTRCAWTYTTEKTNPARGRGRPEKKELPEGVQSVEATLHGLGGELRMWAEEAPPYLTKRLVHAAEIVEHCAVGRCTHALGNDYVCVRESGHPGAEHLAHDGTVWVEGAELAGWMETLGLDR